VHEDDRRSLAVADVVQGVAVDVGEHVTSFSSPGVGPRA
jgi:hypothetical protein